MKEVDERGLGERSLLGLYDAGAVTRGGAGYARRSGVGGGPLVASGGRDGYLRVWRVPRDAVDDVDLPVKKKKYRSDAGARLARRGAAKHPNVVTSVTLDPATDTCWTTCLDGVLRRWHVPSDDDKSDSEIAEIALTLLESLETAAPALCSSLCPLERVVYVGTADGDAYAFDAGKTSSSTAAGDGGAPPETSGALVPLGGARGGRDARRRRAAGGASRAPARGPSWREVPPAATERGALGDAAPALVSKLLGHVAAVVGLSTGNPAHLVSGAHDGTVRVWDMPRLSDAPGARRRARDGPRGGHR